MRFVRLAAVAALGLTAACGSAPSVASRDVGHAHYLGPLPSPAGFITVQMLPPVAGQTASIDWRRVYADWRTSYDHLCKGGCIGTAQTGIYLARVTAMAHGEGFSNQLMFVLTTKHVLCINGDVTRGPIPTTLPTYRCTLTAYYDAVTGRPRYGASLGDPGS